MSQRNIGVYILFKADTTQAKAGAAEIKGELAGVNAATRAQAEADTRAAAAIDQTTAARKRQAEATRAQAEAERQAREAAVKAVLGSSPTSPRQTAIAAAAPQVSPAVSGQQAGVDALDAAIRSTSLSAVGLQSAIGRATTSFGPAQSAVHGLTLSLRDQTAAMLEEQRASAAWQSRQDAVRAQFNPLFAASKQYEMQLHAIAQAEREGAISATEAAAARQRASQVMLQPVGPGSGAPSGAQSGMARAAAANLSFQMNDIAMMTMMGQSPMMLVIQQGPQVAQIFSQLKQSGLSLGTALASAFRMVLTPWGLLAMGVIGGGAALVQWMMQAGGGAKSLEQRMEELGTAFDRYRRVSDIARAGSADLARQFGAGAAGARGLYAVLLDLNQLSLDQNLKNTASAAREMIGMSNANSSGRAFTGFFGIGTGAAHVSGYASEIRGFHDALKGFETAEGTNSQISALQIVLEQVREYAQLTGGVSDQEQALIDLLQKQADVLLGIKATETARSEAKRLQLDQMAREQGQQTELAIASRLYGENSGAALALRARHAREALETRLREMDIDERSAEAIRQRGALEARLSAEQKLAWEERQKSGEAILADLTRQGEVSAAILTHGETSAEVDAVRARHAQEIQQQKLLEAGHGTELIAQAQTLLAAEQARVAAIKAQEGGRSADRLLGEMRDQHAIQRARITHGENSLQLRELEIAAERRLFEESLRTLQVSEARKEELRQQWELTNGLASADPFGRVAAGQTRDRDHAAALARMQLELRLVAVGATERARALAIHEAEVRMRREGYELGSREVEQAKSRAAGLADMTAELERQTQAWDKVRQSAEGMIDGPIDALLKGDVKGALASFVGEFASLYSELALKNPLKNRLLGTNYATLDDVGGIGGMFGRGLADAGSERAATVAAMSPASMAVTTPMVTISTSGLSGLPLAVGLGPAANMPFAPTGPSMDAARLQAVAIGGATRPDAITGLNGPFAAALSSMIGDAQRLFGDEAIKVVSAFRSIEVQAKLWSDALQKYGSVAEARKWVAPPGSSNHNFGLAADLRYGNPAVQQWAHANAATYGLGFRMGNEPWHVEPTNASAMRAGASLPVAQLERLATSAEMATGQIGTFGARAETTGQGLAAMGGTFAQALQMFGASKGPGGMLVAGLLGNVFKGLGVPGFSRGGWTGAGAVTDVAGVVHAEEYVFDAATTRRIGVANLEAIRKGATRGYQTGGYVTGGRPAVPAAHRAQALELAAPAAEQRHLFEINVSGTGNSEIAAGVTAAIEQAFDNFNRNVFTDRVRAVIRNEWDA